MSWSDLGWIIVAVVCGEIIAYIVLTMIFGSSNDGDDF